MCASTRPGPGPGPGPARSACAMCAIVVVWHTWHTLSCVWVMWVMCAIIFELKSRRKRGSLTLFILLLYTVYISQLKVVRVWHTWHTHELFQRAGSHLRYRPQQHHADTHTLRVNPYVVKSVTDQHVTARAQVLARFSYALYVRGSSSLSPLHESTP